jgi:hypothetical protein
MVADEQSCSDEDVSRLVFLALLACPLLAAGFSLPEVKRSTYLGTGLSAGTALALTAGRYAAELPPALFCEIIPALWLLNAAGAATVGLVLGLTALSIYRLFHSS